MSGKQMTTVIRLMQLDNNPSTLTSMVMPKVSLARDFLFRQRDTFMRLYITRARYNESRQI